MKSGISRTLSKSALVFSALLAHNSFAGCFDNVNTIDNVNAKISGIYANGPGGNHYVIIDRNNCYVYPGGSAAIEPTTKSLYYLSVNDANTFMLSTLLAAKAQDEEVRFRVIPGDGQTNRIAYAIAPSSSAP